MAAGEPSAGDRFNRAVKSFRNAITINGQPMTVVGIMPEEFDFSSVFTPGTHVDMFLPADLDVMRPWGNTLSIIGRLQPGVTLAQARAEFATLWPRLLQEHKDWSPRWGATLTGLKEHVSGRMRRSLVVLWAAVGFVLLIVCANSPISCSRARPRAAASSRCGLPLEQDEAV